MGKKLKIEEDKVKTLFAHTKQSCHLSGKDDYIVVTEWGNGEGFDVEINNKNNVQRFGMTDGQFVLLKKMFKKIFY